MCVVKILCISYDLLNSEDIKNQSFYGDFEIVYAEKEEDIYNNLKLFIPDIIIMNSNTFNQNLFQFISAIKSFNPMIPIIFCSSLNEEKIYIKALKEGVDICIARRFSNEFFLLQIKSMVEFVKKRKYNIVNCISLGNNSFYNILEHELWVNCVSSKLTSLESRLFYVLCCNLNKITYRNVLLLAGWEGTHVRYELQLNKYIVKFRKLLSTDSSVKLTTIKGFGYRLEVNY